MSRPISPTRLRDLIARELNLRPPAIESTTETAAGLLTNGPSVAVTSHLPGTRGQSAAWARAIFGSLDCHRTLPSSPRLPIDLPFL